MFVAGIDAHTTYSVIAIVNNAGDLVHGPERIPNAQVENLESLLDRFRPVEVVVETCPSWPWLFDRLRGPGIHFVLAHAKRLKVIADSNYKRDDLDAELLARMRLASLVHGSGFRHMILVIRPLPGVTTHEVPETQPVQVREVAVPGSELG